MHAGGCGVVCVEREQHLQLRGRMSVADVRRQCGDVIPKSVPQKCGVCTTIRLRVVLGGSEHVQGTPEGRQGSGLRLVIVVAHPSAGVVLA